MTLKEIKLTVSTDFTIPASLLKNDPTTNEQILSFGASLLDAKSSLLLKSTLDSRSKALTDAHTREIEKHQAEITHLLSQLDLKTSETAALKKQINADKDELYQFAFNKANQTLSARIQDFQNTISILQKNNEKNDLTSSHLTQSIGSLKNTMESYLARISGKTNDIRMVGELSIEDYIYEKFSNAQLKPTSGETAGGDYHLAIGEMNALVESKNVITMRKEDITKFWRDIEYRTSKGEINAALFISCRDTNLFDGRKHFVFRFQNGIPVIYISNAHENMEIVRISILILQHLVENDVCGKETSEELDEEDQYLLEITKDFYNQFSELQNSLKAQKKAIEILVDNFHKQEQIYDKIAKQLQDAILKYPQIKYQSSADISIAKPAINQSITDLYSKIKEKGGDVKRKDMMDWGFNDSFIRQYGGVKKINEAALGTITIDT